MDKPSDVYRLSRKYWLIKMIMFLKRLTSLLLVALPIIFAGCSQQQMTKQQIISRAKVIHKKALTLDTHVDILNATYATKACDPGIDNPKLQCDLVKMNKGGMDGVFLAVYVGQKKRDAEGYKNAYKSAMGQFEAIHRLTEKMYPNRRELATLPGEVERIAKTGKRVIMIGIENGFAIGKDLSNVERFYNLGARYITLSHNDHSEALNVTIELVRRGYSEEDISKIWGANLLRVWREVEKVAQELQKGSNNG